MSRVSWALVHLLVVAPAMFVLAAAQWWALEGEVWPLLRLVVVAAYGGLGLLMLAASLDLLFHRRGRRGDEPA